MNPTKAEAVDLAERMRIKAQTEHVEKRQWMNRALKAENLYREAQRNADNAEIALAHWKTQAILTQGQLTKLEQGRDPQ